MSLKKKVLRIDFLFLAARNAKRCQVYEVETLGLGNISSKRFFTSVLYR